MTIPHLGNCPHSGEGWCLDCVKAQGEEVIRLSRCLENIEQVGHNPADLASDLCGKPDRWQRLSVRLASMASQAIRSKVATPHKPDGRSASTVLSEAYESFDGWEHWMEANAGEHFAVTWEEMELSERTELYSMFCSWLDEQRDGIDK